MKQQCLCAFSLIMLASACGTTAQVDSDTSPVSATLSQVQQDMFGKNGLLAFDENEPVGSTPAPPDATDPNNPTPDDPNDLKDKLDCNALYGKISTDMVALNQENTWNTVVRSLAWLNFQKLSNVATEKDCDAVQDQGEEGGEKLEFDCDVLVPKLHKVWQEIRKMPEWTVLHASIAWRNISTDYQLYKLGNCENRIDN